MKNIQRQNLSVLSRVKRGAPFSVNQILGHEGNVLWLEADRGVFTDQNMTIAAVNNDKIRRWKDGGLYGGSAIQNTDAYRPTYKTGQTPGGAPAISFVKESLQGLVTINQWDYNVFNPTVFVVGKYYSGNGFMGKGNNSADQELHRKMNISPYSSTLCAYWDGSDGQGSNAGVIPSPRTRLDWNIYGVKPLQNNLALHNINGSKTWNRSTIRPSKFNSNNLGIGVDFPDYWQEFVTADIYAVIVFNYSLPDVMFDAMMQYLSTKTGIALV